MRWVRQRARAPAKRRKSAVRGAARLVIATRSGLIEAGLLSLLRDVPELAYVASSSDASGAASLLVQQRPDVLVLDNELVPALRAIYHGASRPRVLLLTSRQHIGTASPCRENCACGLVYEQAPLRHIRAALRIIGACSAPKLGHGYCASCPLRQSLRVPPLPLSPREYAVFERIGLGASNCRIAGEFGVSVKTIETHRENIKRKLGFASAAALNEAAFAWRRGEYTHGAKGEATPRKRVAASALR